MMAWMDLEALTATLATGAATYFSRSRQEQWVKGETSGHHQRVRSVAVDCDGDTVLLRGRPDRPGLPHGDPIMLHRPRCGPGGPMTVTPDLAGFREHARSRRVVPVTRTVLADRPDTHRRLPGSGPGTARHVPARVGRPGQLGALLLRRCRQRRHADRRRGRSGPLGGARARGPSRRRAGRRGAAGHGGRLGDAGAPRVAAVHLGHGRVSGVRRGPALGATARRQPRRTGPARTRHAPGDRPRGGRPHRRHGHAHRQRHQLRRLPGGRRRGLAGCGRARRADDGRPGPDPPTAAQVLDRDADAPGAQPHRAGRLHGRCRHGEGVHPRR